MANDVGLGVGASASNTAVAVGGTVLLALIGGHLITKLAEEHHHKQWRKQRPHHVVGVMNHRHVMDSIYDECLNSASHPHTVHRNRDRIYHAMHQRAPHIKELIMKGHNGQYGPGKMAEGVQNMAEDILLQFDIPSRPHDSAANPRLVQLFKNQRREGINYRYAVPGGLVLDPAERQYLDKEIMSYAGEGGGRSHGGGGGHGDVGDFLGREAGRHQFEGERLGHYYGEHFAREQFRLDRALAGLIPPWIGGNIAPIGPYYNPYPYYPQPMMPSYGPDLLHPGLYPGQTPWMIPGFPSRFR